MISFELNKKAEINVSDKWLNQVAETFAKVNGLKNKNTFSLAFVSGAEIRKWNRLYRGIDKITDVLSFSEDNLFIDPSDKEKYLGEIIICVSQAKKQAKELKHSLKQEIARLLVHGLAHLIGYDHENVSKYKAKQMEDMEDKAMKSLGF